jgi:putative PIN family toxin of toxin-antitoxin system
MRIVMDTNVLVSALLWDGNEQDVLSLCCSGDVRSVSSPMILSELSKVLIDKFNKSVDEVLEYIHEIEMVSELFLPIGLIAIVQADPDDDLVLETAIVGYANVIVTGDRHLLRLERYNDILIMRAKDFLDALPRGSLKP